MAATGEDVSLWRVLRGRGEDPLVRWTRIRERHGDVSRYRYGLDDSHLVTHPEGPPRPPPVPHPEAPRRVLQDNAGNYTKEHPSYSMLRRLVGNGLLTSEGSFWLRQRRLAQPAFHRQRIAGMATQMTKAALDLAGEWEVRSSGPFSMLEEMSGLTLRIVADALFGTGLPARAASVCSGLRPPPVAGEARSSSVCSGLRPPPVAGEARSASVCSGLRPPPVAGEARSSSVCSG